MSDELQFHQKRSSTRKSNLTSFFARSDNITEHESTSGSTQFKESGSTLAEPAIQLDDSSDNVNDNDSENTENIPPSANDPDWSPPAVAVPGILTSNQKAKSRKRTPQSSVPAAKRRGGGGARSSGQGGASNQFTSQAAQKKFYKKLSALDKTALINIVKACIESGDIISMAKVNSFIHSNIDVGSIIQDLEKAKDAVFKALPSPWKYSCRPDYLRNNFAFKRCSPSLSAFKTMLRGQAADMRKLNDVDVQIDYVLKAWPVVSALPQWIGCYGKDKDMSMCLDVLAALFMQAIPKISLPSDQLSEICDDVEGMVSFTGEQDVLVECQKMEDALKLLKEKV